MARLKKFKFNSTDYLFPVEDVKVGTTSVVTDGVATIDLSDINTKTFYLTGTTGATNIATAQAAYDWYLAGKNPVIVYNDKVYTFYSKTAARLSFSSIATNNVGNSVTSVLIPSLYLELSSDTVTSISTKDRTITNGLSTTTNYSTPYTPTYNGSPTTKKYVDDRDTYIGSSQPTSNKVEGRLWYDTTNDQLKVYDGSKWNAVENEYNAGPGIEIGTVQDYSAMQGPAPDGFHVPQSSEWQAVYNILITTFGLATNDTTMGTYLKMPMAGYRNYSDASINSGNGRYWSSSKDGTGKSSYLRFYSTALFQESGIRSGGNSIRAFKNTPIIPNNSWTTLYDGSSVANGAGIFYNATDGLISVSGDGTNWYTIQDKNLGATTVYNQGDTVNDANSGYFYQWGNNYGFAHSGTLTTSQVQVNANTYGPGNYYSSNTFITRSPQYSSSPYNWDSSNNDNLWGGVTGVVTINNAITNTGVLSVNGQTGDVTLASGITKVFTLSSYSDLTTAQDAYDWYVNGGNPILQWTTFYFTLSTYNSSLGLMKFSNIRSNSATTNGPWLNVTGLDITVSNGSVTGITITQNNINIKTSAPTGVGNETITLVI